MVSARCPTTIVERFLLLVTVALTPLQEHLPTIAGYSIMYVWFIFLTSYTIFNRIHILPRVWSQPFFVTGYAMLILTTLIELLHPYSDVFEVVRIGQMFLGAMLIASLCRDRGALKSAMYGYIIAGLWMSILLFLSTYGALSGAAATSFHEASHVRKEVFGENPLQVNLNLMAFVAAQGTVVAVALALMSRSLRRRNLYLGIALLCFVATFLPLSRGGILIVILTSGSILLAYGIKRVKSLMLVGTLGAAMLIWVPDAVFSRLTVVPERSNHRAPAGRVKVYTAALDHLPEYLLIGVGRGNYYEAWGMTSGYFKAASGVVLGPHNWYIAATTYWGLIGVLTLSLLVYQAYRCLPKRCGGDVLSLCLLGVAVSLFLQSFLTHILAAKIYSLGFGLLVAARLWIWPQGIVQVPSSGRSSFRPNPRYVMASPSPKPSPPGC